MKQLWKKFYSRCKKLVDSLSPFPLIVIAVGVLVLISIIFVAIYFLSLSDIKLPTIPREVTVPEMVQSPKPPPTATTKPLPGGLQTYRLSHSSSVPGPKPIVVVLDPLDPANNVEQAITVTIDPKTPAKTVVATLQTDNKSQIINFSASTTPDQWIGKWTANDSYLFTYYLKFITSGDSGEFEGGLKFR